MSMFNLAISFLTMSNLPWFMDLIFQVPMQYCSLQHWTLLSPPDTSSWALFMLWPSHFILTGVISNCPLFFPSSILGTWPGGLIFWCHIFLPFHMVHSVLQTIITKWFAIYFSSGPHFARTLHSDPYILGGPAHMAHSFIALCKPLHPNKAVIHERVSLFY